VDDVTIDASSIFTTASALQLRSPTPISILDNQRITGLGDPVNQTDAVNKRYSDGSTIIGLQVDISGLNANIGNNYLDVKNILEYLFPVAGYDSGSSEPPLGVFTNSVIPPRNQGTLARVLTIDYGVGGGFTIPTLDFSSLKNFTPVDQTITIAQRTISSIQTYANNNGLGATTKITCTASHFYETGQAVVISGTTFSGAIGTIDGNYTVTGAEFPAEFPNYVSITINLDTSSGPYAGLDGTNYNANSGTIERTPVVGAGNKQVLEDVSNATNVTGTISFTPVRKLVQFGVYNGVWQFDRELTLTF